MACWTVFAAAAIVFLVDAMATIQVVAMQPFAIEQNPIARWTLGVHPAAPWG